MTEDEARAWVADRFDKSAVSTLTRLVNLVREEAERQNLVAPSTLGSIWSRHVVDSLQLVALAPSSGTWLDIGTGGGFPGLAVACVRRDPMMLVEPRRLRATFLADAAASLDLSHVEVATAKVEDVNVDAAIITARAVGPVGKLLRAASRCATTQTRWLLPRGKLDADDLAELRARGRGTFHVKQSVTDPASSILIIDGLGTGR